MIVTDDFVVINFPKTGSTFIRQTLSDIHTAIKQVSFTTQMRWRLAGRYKRHFHTLQYPNIRIYGSRRGTIDDHGIISQIPPEYQHLKIVSCIRNPFERLVSSFLYEDWKKIDYVGDHKNVIKKSQYKKFPDLSFAEYVHFIYDWDRQIRFPDLNINSAIGMQTIQFVQFFDRSPEVYLQGLNGVEDFNVNRYRDITFLHTEKLNTELYQFLKHLRYPEEVIEPVPARGKINKSSYDGHWTDYYTPELWSFVSEKEAPLLKLFPEYNLTREEYDPE